MGGMQNILGTMMATGMAGRSRRGMAFAAAPELGMGAARTGMGSFKQKAGLAALGFLAYRAYQDYQKNRQFSPQNQTAGQRTAPHTESPSLGDRLGGFLQGGVTGSEQLPAAEPTVDDDRALLLIRAMIAAANADGEISPDERQRILSHLEQAGASPDERRTVEGELASPCGVDDLIRQVNDPEMAEQVYLASTLAIEPDSQAEQSYLRYLADRLNLSPERTEELRRIA